MIVEIPILVTEVNKYYLASKFDVDPFILTKKNIFGIFLLNSLCKKKNLPINNHKMDIAKYDHSITVQITERAFKNSGYCVPNKTLIDFNNMVRFIFLDEFHAYMDFHVTYNRSQIRQCIIDFMRKCNLHEDIIGIRTLEKDYERYRDRQNEILGNFFKKSIA